MCIFNSYGKGLCSLNVAKTKVKFYQANEMNEQ